MIDKAVAAAEQIFSTPFRAVFWKALGLTVLLLAVVAFALEKVVIAYVVLPYAWLATLIHLLAGVGLMVGLTFLVTPVTFVVAGLFFDELAEHVEMEIAGPAGRGRAMPLAPAAWIGLKFGLLSMVLNVLALLMLLVPGVNLVAFFGVNAYLLGRGFFELAALRYLPMAEVRELRRIHSLRIFACGCIVAGLAAIPLAQVLTPLFATAFLVRVAQPLVRRRLAQPGPPAAANWPVLRNRER